jgi:hypothetical protein
MTVTNAGAETVGGLSAPPGSTVNVAGSNTREGGGSAIGRALAKRR